MMNTGLITRYTTALYSAPEACRPRYDEFRDMFSDGQLKSKIWLAEELSKLQDLSGKTVAIAGSWYATLAFILLEYSKNKNLNLVCIDIDKRCEEFARHLRKEHESEIVKCVTQDMFRHHYTEDIVINTSCEHLFNLNDWLNLIPSGVTVVLQSNNLAHPTHVSCVKSLDEFKSQTLTNFSAVLFEGELNLGVYTRYMIIGRKA
jgi:hypothetical protein